MQHDEAAGLTPVHGSPSAVYELVADWLDSSDASPLTIRTSGSTGRSKDVQLSSSAIRVSAEAALSRLGGPGRWVLALPVNYVAGLQVVSRSALASTSPVVLADFDGLAAASRILTGDRRYIACVPTQLYRWLADDATKAALATFDAVVVGGAAAGPDLVDRARQADVSVVTTYGMTETCGGCVYDGIPLDGASVAVGADGAIRIAGLMLFDGYLDEPDATAAVLREGWYLTGDIGAIDDGRLVVSGRADDVVMSGGVNVSLGAVERRLRDLTGVESVCVVGQPDEQWGTRVVAFVVPDGRVGPQLDAMRDFVAGTLPRTWAPRELVLVDEIPLLDSGKPDREALRRARVPVSNRGRR